MRAGTCTLPTLDQATAADIVPRVISKSCIYIQVLYKIKAGLCQNNINTECRVPPAGSPYRKRPFLVQLD